MRFLLLVLLIFFSVSTSYARGDSEAHKIYREQLNRLNEYTRKSKKELTAENSKESFSLINEQSTITENANTEVPMVILKSPELTDKRIKDRDNIQKSILERRRILNQSIADRRKSIQRSTKEKKDNE